MGTVMRLIGEQEQQCVAVGPAETLGAVHVYSPGVAATRHVWPAATAAAADGAAITQCTD